MKAHSPGEELSYQSRCVWNCMISYSSTQYQRRAHYQLPDLSATPRPWEMTSKRAPGRLLDKQTKNKIKNLMENWLDFRAEMLHQQEIVFESVAKQVVYWKLKNKIDAIRREVFRQGDAYWLVVAPRNVQNRFWRDFDYIFRRTLRVWVILV